MNTPLPDLEAELKTTGFGYAGADLFAAGFNLGKKGVEVCGLEAGDKAFVWGLASMPNRGERTKGAIAGVESMGVEVVYQEIPDNVNSDASQGTPMYVCLLYTSPSPRDRQKSRMPSSA